MNSRPQYSTIWLIAACSVLAGGSYTAVASQSAQRAQIVYRLAPFDKISIAVYGEADLSTEQLISDDGKAFVPLLGPMELAGLTIAEAARLVEVAFVKQEYLRQPFVTISIEAFSPKVVTVLGEVKQPGNVSIPPGRNGLAIQIAIAEAGGFTGTAKAADVRVTRVIDDRGGRTQTIVNVDDILNTKRRKSQTDYIVQPDDVVFVPRRVF